MLSMGEASKLAPNRGLTKLPTARLCANLVLPLVADALGSGPPST